MKKGVKLKPETMEPIESGKIINIDDYLIR